MYSPKLEVNTDAIELWMESREDLGKFNRQQFVRILEDVLDELGLSGIINRVNVDGPLRGRSELFRDSGWATDSSEVNLEISLERYLDRSLLLHEFGHEADRRNPGFGWKSEEDIGSRDALEPFHNLAWNISLDSRLHPRGLSKDYRWKEFEQVLGREMADENRRIFETSWERKISTHQEVLELARELNRIAHAPIKGA